MTEAYRVGVTFALNNLVSAELAKIAQQFTTTNKAAKELHSTMMTLAKIAVVGAGIAFAVVVKDSIEEARKFESEVARFAAMGFGDKITQQAVKFAKGLDIMGQSYTDIMKLIREATAVTGDPETGMQLAARAAKMESALQAYMEPDKASQAASMMLDVFKTTELRGDVLDRKTGKFNAAKVGQDFDATTQVYISTGGMVTPQQLFNFIKTGGVAAKGLSAEAFYFQESHAMQETGGFRAGTSLMSNYQNLAMGRTTTKVIKELVKDGLLDPSFVEYDKIGRVKGVKPGGLKNSMEFLNSQFDWFEKNIEPKLKGLSQGDALIKISSLSSNRTAMNRNTQFYLERENILKAVKLGHQSDTVDTLYDREMQTNQALTTDLTKKWSDLMITLGTSILPDVNRGLRTLSAILRRIDKALQWLSTTGFDHAGEAAAEAPGFVSWLLNQAGHGNSVLPPTQGSTIQLKTVVMTPNLRVLGEAMTEHNVNAMRTPGALSGNNFDGRATPAVAGH